MIAMFVIGFAIGAWARSAHPDMTLLTLLAHALVGVVCYLVIDCLISDLIEEDTNT